MATGSAAQPAADARLLATSRAAEPEVIRTLEALVAIEPGSAQIDGLNRVADLAEPCRRALGASVERLALTTERGRALPKHAQSIYTELDGRYLALVPTTGGGTDAGFAGRSGRAVVMESFGLAGHGNHGRDEFIEIDSIAPRLYLVTRLMMDIGAGKVPALEPAR